MVSGPDRLDELTQGRAATSSRGALRRLLTAIGTRTSIMLGFLFISGPAAAQCDRDFPTEASLRAARTAIASGATDVAISPGGCLRYQRWFWPGGPPEIGAPEQQREETTFDGKVIEAWDYFTAKSGPVGTIPSVVLYSFGRRDANGDGFNEWQATVLRDITPPKPVGRPIRITVTEYKPNSQLAANRVDWNYKSSDTIQVTIEEVRSDGSVQVVAKYDAPAIVEAAERTPAGTDIRPQEIPCPPELKKEVDDLSFRISSKGCLHDLGLHREALRLGGIVARGLDLHCETGTQREASVDIATLYDRQVFLVINPDNWSALSDTRREVVVSHELLHAALQEGHDPVLENLLRERKMEGSRFLELDRIGACNSLCYNPDATRCECATCLGMRVSDAVSCNAQCGGYKACNWPANIGGFCNCPVGNHTWYDRLSECETVCRSGLACAFVGCAAEENACKF